MICMHGIPPHAQVGGVCPICNHMLLAHLRRPDDNGQTCSVCAIQETENKKPYVHLVIMDTGGMFGIYYDYDRAVEVARNIFGTVTNLPIHRDFRKPGWDIQHGQRPDNPWEVKR